MPCCQILRICEAMRRPPQKYSHHLDYVFFDNKTLFLTDLYSHENIIYDYHDMFSKEDYLEFIEIVKKYWERTKKRRATIDTNPRPLWMILRPQKTFPEDSYRRGTKRRMKFDFYKLWRSGDYHMVGHDTNRWSAVKPFLMLVLGAGRRWGLTECHVNKMLSYDKQIQLMFKYGIRSTKCGCVYTEYGTCITPLIRRSCRIRQQQQQQQQKQQKQKSTNSLPLTWNPNHRYNLLPLVEPPQPIIGNNEFF